MSVQAKKYIQIKVAATTRMFKTVYADIRADVSFYQHKTIVLLQKIDGVDLGKHYGTTYGAIEITKSISSQMMSRLLDQIKKEDNPFL